jgi:hypothetical protein
MFARLFMTGSSVLPNAGQVVGGAFGLNALSDTIDVLTKNPMIPLAIASIVLFVVIQKK